MRHLTWWKPRGLTDYCLYKSTSSPSIQFYTFLFTHILMSYCFYCVYIHIYVSFTFLFSFLLSLVAYVWCWGNPKGRKVIRLHHFNVHISTSNPLNLSLHVVALHLYRLLKCYYALFLFLHTIFFIYLQFLEWSFLARSFHTSVLVQPEWQQLSWILNLVNKM